MSVTHKFLTSVATGVFCLLGANATLASSEHEKDNLLAVAYVPAMPDEDSGAYLVLASDEITYNEAAAARSNLSVTPRFRPESISLEHKTTSGHTSTAAASKEPIVLASAVAYGSSPSLTNNELDHLRGGFSFGGMDFKFGWKQETLYNGEVINSQMFGEDGLFGKDGLFGEEGVLGNNTQQQAPSSSQDKSWKNDMNSWKSPDTKQGVETAAVQTIQGTFGKTETDGTNTTLGTILTPETIQQAAAGGGGNTNSAINNGNTPSPQQQVGSNAVISPVFSGNNLNFGKLIQVGVNGSPTPVITDIPGLSTIIQNSLNQVNIQHVNTIDIMVQGAVDAYKAQVLGNAFNQQAINALK